MRTTNDDSRKLHDSGVPTLGLPGAVLFLTNPACGFRRGEMQVLGVVKNLGTAPWMAQLVAESTKVQELLARARLALGNEKGRASIAKLMEESRGVPMSMVEYMEWKLPELLLTVQGLQDKDRLGFGSAFEKSALKTICGRALDPEATCTCGGLHQ